MVSVTVDGVYVTRSGNLNTKGLTVSGLSESQSQGGTTGELKKSKDKLLLCNFCDKRQAQVAALIRNNGTCICNECVVLCAEILCEDLGQRISGLFEKASKIPYKKKPKDTKVDKENYLVLHRCEDNVHFDMMSANRVKQMCLTEWKGYAFIRDKVDLESFPDRTVLIFKGEFTVPRPLHTIT